MKPAPKSADDRRHRGRVLGCLAATIALGLASRRWPLPVMFSGYIGDSLYTVAVFFGLGLLAPAVGSVRLGVAAFAVSALVEFGQLLQWPWLVTLRSTRLGGLVLGQGFELADLLAYAIGAVVIAGLEAAVRPRPHP